MSVRSSLFNLLVMKEKTGEGEERETGFLKNLLLFGLIRSIKKIYLWLVEKEPTLVR